VVFASAAPNLVANDANRATDVFVRSHRQDHPASAASRGLALRPWQAKLPRLGQRRGRDDGRFVAFESDATTLCGST
jgi:hypothetical protein